MKQSDRFGQFNRDIRNHNEFMRAGLTNMVDVLRDNLISVSRPGSTFYDTDGYINMIVDGYVQFAHMVRSLKLEFK